LASVAPWGAEGLDYLAGTGEFNVEQTLLMLNDPVAARAECERNRVEMLTQTVPELMQFLKTLLAPVDAAAVTGELGQYLIDATRSGMATSSDGWWDDGMAIHEPWGFEFGSIRTPVLLLHGRHDRFVPFAHGEWLARNIPGVEARLTDDDGHLTLTTRHLDAVHHWLLERM
jgi:pimeloyl-ACP methyl ester carboxylesterase